MARGGRRVGLLAWAWAVETADPDFRRRASGLWVSLLLREDMAVSRDQLLRMELTEARLDIVGLSGLRSFSGVRPVLATVSFGLGFLLSGVSFVSLQSSAPPGRGRFQVSTLPTDGGIAMNFAVREPPELRLSLNEL